MSDGRQAGLVRRSDWRDGAALGTLAPMSEPVLDDEDRKLLFEVLFDIRTLLARLVEFVVGGDDDGGEEEEEADEP